MTSQHGLGLTLTLNVDYPLDSPEELFTLQFWFTRLDTGATSDITTIDVPKEALGIASDTPLQLALPSTTNSLSHTLNVRLYSLGVHDEGIMSQICLGTGFAATIELSEFSKKYGAVHVEIVLSDVESHHQGTLVLEHRDTETAEWIQELIPLTEVLSNTKRLCDALIKVAEDVYTEESYQHNDRQVFYRISTDNGFLPLLCFPLLATMSTTLDETQGRFLLNLLYTACFIEQVEIDELGNVPTWKLLRVLNETAIAMTKTLVYTADKTRKRGRDGKTTHLFSEAWERILLYPYRARASFDCEDAALMIQEILYHLRTNTTLPAPLRYLRKLLAKYTVFSCQGDLDVGHQEWVAHCYVVAHDTAYIDSLLDTPTGSETQRQEWLPSVVFEGTSWIGGVWNQPPEPVNSSENMVTKSDLANQFLRPYMSATEARDQRVYGPVCQMQTADHHGRVLNLLCTTPPRRTGEKPWLGIELADFMDHRVQPGQLVVKGSVDTPADIERLKSELLDLPLSVLPHWSDDSERVVPAPTTVVWPTGQLVLRAYDYKVFKDEFDAIIPQGAERHVLKLTDDGCAFVLIRTSSVVPAETMGKRSRHRQDSLSSRDHGHQLGAHAKALGVVGRSSTRRRHSPSDTMGKHGRDDDKEEEVVAKRVDVDKHTALRDVLRQYVLNDVTYMTPAYGSFNPAKLVRLELHIIVWTADGKRTYSAYSVKAFPSPAVWGVKPKGRSAKALIQIIDMIDASRRYQVTVTAHVRKGVQTLNWMAPPGQNSNGTKNGTAVFTDGLTTMNTFTVPDVTFMEDTNVMAYGEWSSMPPPAPTVCSVCGDPDCDGPEDHAVISLPKRSV